MLCRKRCLIGLQLSTSWASIKHLLDVNLCLVERQLTIERLLLGEITLTK